MAPADAFPSTHNLQPSEATGPPRPFRILRHHYPACHQPTLFQQPTAYKRAKRRSFLNHFEICVTPLPSAPPTGRLSYDLRPTSERTSGPPLPFRNLPHPLPQRVTNRRLSYNLRPTGERSDRPTTFP